MSDSHEVSRGYPKTDVTQGEFDDLVAQLPNDYRQDLLTTAPVDEQRS
ncbi:hypothetical protein [Sciscionella marina]|nr:hypothetical protein [Sciscionella marina]